MGHLGNRGTAKQHHRAFEQRRRCGLLGCRYSPALPALLSDATPNRGLRVLCVFIVLISSLRLMRRLPQGRGRRRRRPRHWRLRAGRAATTGTEAPQAPLCLTNRPTNRPNRTDKPTNRPTEPNSNQRQRHNNPNQQRRPTTTDNRPVNRQTLSNSGYLVVPYGKFVREIQQVL